MSNCRENTAVLSCYTDAAGVPSTVYTHHVYDVNAAVIGLYHTDGTGAIIDTSGGSVAAGQCAIAQPDVQYEPLCDVLADGTVVPFFRRSITSFDAAGAVIDPVLVADFEVDKVTAYAVQGVVGDCDACEPETALGLITDLAALA